MKNSRIVALAFVLGFIPLTAAAYGPSGPPAPYCGPGQSNASGWTTKAYDENDQWLATFGSTTQADGQAQCQAFLSTYVPDNH